MTLFNHNLNNNLKTNLVYGKHHSCSVDLDEFPALVAFVIAENRQGHGGEQTGGVLLDDSLERSEDETVLNVSMPHSPPSMRQ